VRFWDSSAVVPLLVRQPQSPRIDEWWSQDNDAVLWTLTPVEVTSALWRLVRDRSVSEAEAQIAEARALEFAAASRVVIDVEGVKELACRSLRLHSLTGADACQLAAALVWAGGRPHGKTLLTLDDRLAASARREGFDVP
jgi:predicted nucleic acid-binding protein